MASLFVIFAVKEESRPFQTLIGTRSDLRVVLTGIGQRNAERAIRKVLAEQSPELVLTCGFAGGLNPELAVGTVVFSVDEALSSRLGNEADLLARSQIPPPYVGGYDPAATLSSLSPALRAAGARPARFQCVERVVTTATALDFNRLMDADQYLSYGKLTAALLKSPGKIGALLMLQKQTQAAAENLARVLVKIISNRTQAQL